MQVAAGDSQIEDLARGLAVVLDVAMSPEKKRAILPLLNAIVTPPEGDWEIGSIGQWKIVDILGAGGMAIVLLAFHRDTGRRGALKVIRPDVLSGAPATFKERFEHEIAMMESVRSEFFVEVRDKGFHRRDSDSDEFPFFCMEYVQGRTLTEKTKRWRGRLPQREVVRIGVEVASGLRDMHAKSYFHRDLSPNNILLDTVNYEKVKITDFGLAFCTEEVDRGLSFGQVVGTPEYIAPERWKDHRAITAQGDLFSLGCVLYRALAGRNAFDEKSTLQRPRGLRDVVPNVDRGLAMLVMQLLEQDPSKRPESADHVVRALDLIGHSLVDAPGICFPDWPQPSVDGIRQALGEIAGRSFGIPRYWHNGPAGVLLGLARQSELASALMDSFGFAIEELGYLSAGLTAERPRTAANADFCRKSLHKNMEGLRDKVVTAANQAVGLPNFLAIIRSIHEKSERLQAEVGRELDAVDADWGRVPSILRRAAKDLLQDWAAMLNNHQLVNDLLMGELHRLDAPYLVSVQDAKVLVSGVSSTLPPSPRRNEK